ncbi:MAG: hypothetical protein EBS39_06590 [Gammaproteobacteria bacterium]|nr:hypothetical protein [Gammaproteobacteria bacterium]
MILRTLCTLALLAGPVLAGEKEMRHFLDSLRRVETGGLPAAGIGAVGDGGAVGISSADRTAVSRRKTNDHDSIGMRSRA